MNDEDVTTKGCFVVVLSKRLVELEAVVGIGGRANDGIARAGVGSACGISVAYMHCAEVNGGV